MSERLIDPIAPEQFFCDALHKALKDEGVSVSDAAIVYVVLLLADPKRSAVHPDETLSDEFSRALQMKRAEAAVHLRRIGDKALLFSGLWWEHELRPLRPSNLPLYVNLGSIAYRRAGGVPWAELAEKFQGMVDALVRFGTARESASVRGLLRIYRRWEETRSPGAARALAAKGIIVGMPSSKEKQ